MEKISPIRRRLLLEKFQVVLPKPASPPAPQVFTPPEPPAKEMRDPQERLSAQFFRISLLEEKLALFEQMLLQFDSFSENIEYLQFIDTLLYSAHTWVSPEYWGRLSEILLKHHHREVEIPQLLHFFSIQQYMLHPLEQEQQIWSPWLNHPLLQNTYFPSVSKLHLMLVRKKINLDIFAECYQKVPLPLWNKLCEHLLDALSGEDPETTEALGLLSLFSRSVPVETRMEKARELCQTEKRLPFALLEFLHTPEFKTIWPTYWTYKSRNYKLTSSDLLEWVEQSQSEPDLYWRIMTILHGRGKLPAHQARRWQISGENRVSFGYSELGDDDFRALLQEFPRPVYQVLRLYLASCSEIREILFGSQDKKKLLQHKNTWPVNLVKVCTETFVSSKWVSLKKTDLAKTFETGFSFVEEDLKNSFSQTASYLSHVLGFSLFGFDFARLKNILQGSDLKRSIGQMDPDLLSLYSKKSVMRLALLFCPHPFEALSTLKTGDLRLLWDLEALILSENYTRFRKRQGLQNTGVIPMSISSD